MFVFLSCLKKSLSASVVVDLHIQRIVLTLKKLRRHNRLAIDL